MVLLFQHLKMWLQQQFALVLVFFYWKNVHFSHYLLNLHRPPLASSRDENNQLIQDSFTVLLKFFTRNAASQFCHFRISHLMCKQVFIILANHTYFLKLPSEWIQLLHIFSFEQRSLLQDHFKIYLTADFTKPVKLSWWFEVVTYILVSSSLFIIFFPIYPRKDQGNKNMNLETLILISFIHP